MFNYVKAELGRLSSKKSNYIVYGIEALLFSLVFFLLGDEYRNVDTLDILFRMNGIGSLILVAIGIQTFITVYCDDVSGKTMSTVLSSGVSKFSYVIGKLITSIIYLFFVLLAYQIYITVLYVIVGGELASIANYILPNLVSAFFMMLTIVSVSQLGMLVLYSTQKTSITISIVSLIFLDLLYTILFLLGMAFSPLENLAKYTPVSCYTMIDTSISMGQPIEIGYVIALLVVTAVGMVGSVFILKHKELEIN